MADVWRPNYETYLVSRPTPDPLFPVDIDAVIERLSSRDRTVSRDAAKELDTLAGVTSKALIERFHSASAPLRGRLLRAIAKHRARDKSVVPMLIAALDDDDPKSRKTAVIALGKVKSDDAEEALMRAWRANRSPEERRIIAEALGKVGSARAMVLLRDSSSRDELNDAMVARAALILERTHARTERSAILPGVAPTRPIDIVFECRVGLESLLIRELAGDEAAAWRASTESPGRVRATLRGPLESVFVSRTMTRVAFPLDTIKQSEASLVDAVVGAVTSPHARKIMSRWTDGTIRYRLDFANGHKRAVAWECARQLNETAANLRNDPTQSTWEFGIEETRDRYKFELRPRALHDPRFLYRVESVPAASHPSIAAALARAFPCRPGDVVWDPFAGSGTELIERAFAGPYSALFASDVDPKAIAIARKNAAAAKISRASFLVGDAMEMEPPLGVNVILTNPPMGMRVALNEKMPRFYDRFLKRVASVLPPNGQFAWISPMPRETAVRGVAHGLKLEWAQRVDMGGFSAELQLFVRRAGARPPL